MKKLGNEKNQNVGVGPVHVRKEKGITLIALIITIIVMLILVMVTIQVLFNTGLFDAAGKATQKWNEEQDKEANMQLTIGDKTYGSIEEYLGTENVDYEKLEEELKEKLSKESGNAAIDQYGNIVDLSLWNIEITGEDTCRIAGDAFYDDPGTYKWIVTYIGYDGDINKGVIEGNIPAFVKQGDKMYKVTDLYFVFTNITGLTVFPEIPFTVTSIGFYSFEGCTGLTSIEIPSSVTSIGASAFSRCGSLANIEIPSSVTSIGSEAFYGCSSLTSIEIPASVTSIGASAFSRCSSLTSIEIPASVTSIGGHTFYGCSSLTSIEIPANVTSIESYAFAECNGLTSIIIPDSVTKISYDVFNNCSSLTDVYYTGTEEQWKSISIDSYGNSDLTSATIHYNYTGE